MRPTFRMQVNGQAAYPANPGPRGAFNGVSNERAPVSCRSKPYASLDSENAVMNGEPFVQR